MEKTYTRAEVNQILEVVANSAAADTGMRQRMSAAVSGGYDWADTLHNIYLDFGYPLTLTFSNFWNMYRRFGVAARVVELYPDLTWKESPTIEAPEPFLRDLERLIERGLWRRAKALDTRQRVGRYAGAFMRVRDGKQPKEKLNGKLPGVDSLMDIIPLYESQLEVVSTDEDPLSDRFGLPAMYRFNPGSAGNRSEHTASSFEIHPSRVVIAAEGADNGGIYGISSLESVYNSLMDLRKVLGGGGEGFYKNAAQNVVFDLKDAASATANAALLDKFNENYDDFSQNRSRRALWTPGMEAKTLDSTLAQPKEFALNPLMDISAGSGLPLAEIAGNQTGKLAGDQDKKSLLGNVQSRRENFGTGLVKSLLDWCVRYGVLPSAAYSVSWPDAMAASTGEKLANADTMADVNEKSFKSALPAPFTGEEIREAAGYDAAVEPDELPPDETLENEG